MEELKKDFEVGKSNVLRAMYQFLPFFIAAFIIESLFLSLFTVGWSVDGHYRKTIGEEYSYDYILEGMDDVSYTVFMNKLIDLDPVEGQIATELIHETYEIYDGVAHRIYVTLNKANFQSSYHFKAALASTMEEAPPSFTCVESPTLLRNEYRIDNLVVIAVLWVAIFLISVFLLVSVYRVRISHYRFMYGVYMTCGAGYKKLVRTAVFEMLTVFAISLIPAYICSCVTVFIIFKGAEMSVAYVNPLMLLALVSSVGVILAAVGVPMRIVASDMPINLINKGGTAEYVVSPRRSAKLFGKNFPFFYEFLSIRRFIKYYAVLLLMCVVFNSLFITGIYAGQLTDEIREEDRGVLLAECNTGFDDEELIQLYENKKIDYIMWENSTSGISVLSYLKIDKAMNINGQGYTVDSREGSDATFSVEYISYDRLLVDILKDKELATFEGDPYALFKNDGILRVVISRDIVNVERFDFNVGDQITVSICSDTYTPSFNEYMGELDMLSEIVRDREYGIAEYTDLTLEICAIVDYSAPSGSLAFCVTPEIYETLGGDPERTAVEIHTEREITPLEESELYDEVAQTISIYNNWKITRTFSAFIQKLASDTYILGVFIVVAIFVLLGVPVVWLFSQKVFYEKRDSEIELLRCIGADEKRLFQLYLSDGVVVAVAAFVITAILSALLSAFIFGTATILLPFFGFEGVWKLRFSLSPITLLVSALTCTLCGFAASMLAYLKGKRIREHKEKEYLESRKESK